jgi:MerR family redox-sensitive transcriptional activator SoxR
MTLADLACEGLKWSVHLQANLKSSPSIGKVNKINKIGNNRNGGTDTMKELTISEVARQAGLRPSTIRYYESIDVLPPPQRVNGRRRYDPTILERLAFIQTAQKLGFTLAEIQLLLHERDSETPLSERWQTLAQQKLADIDVLLQRATDVKQLLVQGLRCDCSNLFDCIQCIQVNCEAPRR